MTCPNTRDLNQTVRVGVLFETVSATSHRHHGQPPLKLEDVHYTMYGQFLTVETETLRKSHACGLDLVATNQL